MDTLFDLDSVTSAPAAPATKQRSTAALISARATNRTKAQSEAIGAWARGRALDSVERAYLRGAEVVCDYGRVSRIVRVFSRPDGEVSFLLGEDGARESDCVELLVRADVDGSFVTAVGERFVMTIDLPANGEDSGADIGIAVGDLCVGVGFWPEVVIARRGRWGFVRSVGGEHEENARFLCDLVTVPATLIPTNTAKLSAEDFERAVTIGAEDRRAVINRLISGVRDATAVRKLWEEFVRVPPELRDHPVIAPDFAPLRDIFEFSFAAAGWIGFATVDLSYGWRVDVSCEVVEIATGAMFEETFGIPFTDGETLASLFDETRRGGVVANGLTDATKTPAGSEEPTARNPSVSGKEKVSPEALEGLRETAAMLGRAALTDAEREDVAQVLAFASGAKLPSVEFERLRARLWAIATRLGGELTVRADHLIALDCWGATELNEARAMAEAEVRPTYSQSLRLLDAFVAAHLATPVVAEVAVGWWVALQGDECSHGGSHGAVSSTGYRSLCQSAVATPEDAMNGFLAEKPDHDRYSKHPRVQDVVAWVRSLGTALEYNCAHNLIAWIERLRRTEDVRKAVRAGVVVLGQNGGAEGVQQLQRVLAETSWLDPYDRYAAACVGGALATKFGPLTGAKREEASLFEDEERAENAPGGDDNDVDDEEETIGDDSD